MKEMVRAIFAPGLTVEAVGALLDRLLARLSRCRLRPFIRLGKTIRKHREGILAARRLKLSNARAEALNNKVKLIVRRAYGFHSAQAALALVHLTCVPITLTLPHEHAFAYSLLRLCPESPDAYRAATTKVPGDRGILSAAALPFPPGPSRGQAPAASDRARRGGLGCFAPLRRGC